MSGLPRMAISGGFDGRRCETSGLVLLGCPSTYGLLSPRTPPAIYGCEVQRDCMSLAEGRRGSLTSLQAFRTHRTAAFMPITMTACFVSSDSGVIVLDRSNRTTIDRQHGLPADAMGPVLLDSGESLWLGTLGGGLIRRLGHGEWLSWKKEDGLLHNTVWAIRHDRAGQIWVGTSGGLSILGPNGRSVRSWTSHNGLAGDRVLAIAEGPAGDFFVGTDPAGISRFSKQGTILRTYKSGSGLTSEPVYALAVDRQRRLWAGGPGGCVRSREPLDKTTELKFDRVAIPGLAEGTSVQDVLVDEGGIVWLATSHGLARFDSGRWKVFLRADGLKSENLEVIAQGQGAFWLAYRDSLGITRLQIDGEHYQITDITKQDGLPSDQIIGLAFDRSGPTLGHHGQRC